MTSEYQLSNKTLCLYHGKWVPFQKATYPGCLGVTLLNLAASTETTTIFTLDMDYISDQSEAHYSEIRSDLWHNQSVVKEGFIESTSCAGVWFTRNCVWCLAVISHRVSRTSHSWNVVAAKLQIRAEESWGCLVCTSPCLAVPAWLSQFTF